MFVLGIVGSGEGRQCHFFTLIPTKYCSNLFNSYFLFYLTLEVLVHPSILNSTFQFNK